MAISRPIDMIMPAVDRVAARHAIDKALLAAFVKVESSMRPWVTRFEPATDRYLVNVDIFAKKCGTTPETERVHQKTSWGLVQVMGFTARDLGFEGNLPELCLPETGLDLGAKYLKQLQGRFGKGEAMLEWDENVVAAYNAGSPRRLSNGKLVNDDYVRKVERAYWQTDKI